MSARAARGVALGLAIALWASVACAGDVADVAPFDRLLRANVRSGEVDYPAFRDDPGFRSYVAALGQPVRLEGRAETLAWHINAYNALAIQGILDGLSPSTFLGRQRYFKLRGWPLAGRSISLDALENDVIRPLGEPRIHFAIVCASKSCPPLRGEAYTASRIDAQLDDQARRFVNDPARNRFDKQSRTAYLSEIFKWFAQDFERAGSVQRYIASYAADAEVARELARDAYRVEWLPYDWSLNGTPPR